jgi:uncharacterized metal-binding protein
MANFATHITVAASASAVGGLIYWATGSVSAIQALLLTAAGSLGGMLPDIDSDNSRPVRIVSHLVFVILGFFLIQLFKTHSWIELAILIGIFYLAFHYAMIPTFKKFTSHRGIFHSLLAGLFFAILYIVLTFYFYRSSSAFAWLAGFFIFAGFLIHLILDEIYSVDFSNRRIKKSFGTALKLVGRNTQNNLIMAAMIVVLFFLTPPISGFGKLLFFR